MKRIGFLFSFFLLLLFLLSHGTVIGQEHLQGYNKIMVINGKSDMIHFPASMYNAPPDKLFRSHFAGKVVDSQTQREKLNIFNDKLVIQMETDYVFYNESKKLKYYVMVYDFKSTVTEGVTVKPGDVIGQVDNRIAKVLVFSETLDPYLVISSNRPPVFYNGYYWFSPAFLSSAGTARWLTFDPVDNIGTELSEIAVHVKQEVPGLSLYDKRIRFLTKLPQFPRNITDDERKSIQAYERILYGRNGVVANISEINSGGYKFLLCWQNGFLDHLKKEYVLNNDIWLYGVVLTYNAWEEKGYIFLRDFTLVSPETIYEARLNELKGQ